MHKITTASLLRSLCQLPWAAPLFGAAPPPRR